VIMSSTLEKALQLAATGFYVFPLQPNGKKPIIKHWREYSTTDPEIIKAWFKREAPNIAVDCGKSELVVIDVDEKLDAKTGIKKEGMTSLRALKAEGFICEKTYIVKTPTGGLHLYYKEQGLSNSVSSFAKDIDIRADGGYVVSEGSTIDRMSYEAINTAPIALLMPWAIERCKRSIPKEQRQTEISLSEDAPADIEWAIAFLKDFPEAVESAAGDAHTYKMFCRLKEHGLSKEKALEVADTYWNPKCSPPWEPEDLAVKADNAYAYAQNATGSHSIAIEFQDPPILQPITFIKTEGYLVQTDCQDAATIPKRDWVFGRIALRKQLTVLIAPGGTGKSTFTIAMALSKASGRDILGMTPHSIGRVAIYNNEDNLEEIKRREAGARQSYGISKSDISDSRGTRVFYGTGDQHMLRVLKKAKDGSLIDEADVKILINQLIKENIDLLVVDPLAGTHNVDENDNSQMLRVAEIFLSIAQQANCAVILIHHTRKRDGRSAEGHSGNMDSLRGASSVASAARIVVTLDTMSKTEAGKYLDINPEDHLNYVELAFAKANMSALSKSKIIYEKISVRIGVTDEDIDGEEVGALKLITLEKCSKSDRSKREQALLDIIIERSKTLNVTQNISDKPIRDDFYTYLDAQSGNEIDPKAKSAAWNRAMKKLIALGDIGRAHEKIHIHIHPQTV